MTLDTDPTPPHGIERAKSTALTFVSARATDTYVLAPDPDGAVVVVIGEVVNLSFPDREAYRTWLAALAL